MSVEPAIPADRAHAAIGAAGGRVAFLVAVMAALVVLSTATLAWATDRIGWQTFLAVHGLVVVALAAFTYAQTRSHADTALPLMATITVAAAGPIGAFAALLTLVTLRPRDADPVRLQDWYDRIALAGESDEATRLCEDVGSGRTAALTGALPASFAAIMEHGSLDDRQTTLGIIARNFDASYVPILKLALKSREPMIRVQAAAVATRIRGDLRAVIDRHAGVPSDTPTKRAGAAIAEIEAALASGLLDEGDRVRGQVMLERLRAASERREPTTYLAPVPVADRAAHEEMLIASGRYGDLRVQRRVTAITDETRYRVRRSRRVSEARA